MEYQSRRQSFDECIAVALVVLSIACASSPLIHKLDGRWTGTIEFPGLKTQVHVVFTTANQNLRGTMDIPCSRTAGLLLNDLEMAREGRVRFNLILPRDRQLHFIGEIRQDSIQGKIAGADVAGRFFPHRARTQTENANAGPKDIAWKSVQRDHWPPREWKTGAPSQHGMDMNGLERAERFILEERPEVRSLLIIRNGRMVYEKYFI